jgi:hypothetical protein
VVSDEWRTTDLISGRLLRSKACDHDFSACIFLSLNRKENLTIRFRFTSFQWSLPNHFTTSQVFSTRLTVPPVSSPTESVPRDGFSHTLVVAVIQSAPCWTREVVGVHVRVGEWVGDTEVCEFLRRLRETAAVHTSLAEQGERPALNNTHTQRNRECNGHGRVTLIARGAAEFSGRQEFWAEPTRHQLDQVFQPIALPLPYPILCVTTPNPSLPSTPHLLGAAGTVSSLEFHRSMLFSRLYR